MSSCVNCGNQFTSKKQSKRGLQAKLDTIERTAKDVLEQEFGLVLTPKQKETRFLCGKCSWNLAALAKSSITKTKAKTSFNESAASSSYLAEKIRSVRYVSKKGRSPAVTPRKIKRQRIFSPEKPSKPVNRAEEPTTLPRAQRQSVKFKVSSQQADMNRAFRYISGRFYKRGINLLMKLKIGFKNALIECVKDLIRNETTAYCMKKNSVLRGKQTLEEISKFDWGSVYDEVTVTCPALASVLTGSLTSRNSYKCLGLSSNQSVSIKPTLGTIVCIIMYMRKPKGMSNFQEMNALQMWLSSTKRETFARFNHLGLCVGIAATRSAIDRIRTNYNTEVLKWKSTAEEYMVGLSVTEDTIPYGSSAEVSEDIADSTSESSMSLAAEPEAEFEPQPRQASEDSSNAVSMISSEHEGKFGYSLCFDNVNTKVTVRHHAKDKKNKMFNMVQGFAAKDRIPTLHLSDVQPTPEEIKNLPIQIYLPSHMDEITLRSEMTVMVTRVLCKYIHCFKGLDDDIQHIQHSYSTESAKKSEMVPLGVIDKDESKVADTIEIMAEYHKYVPSKTDGDPLIIPLHADGLSCERGNDAQCARINATDPWQQLQGLHLNIQEWHKRCTLLQDIYDEFFASGGRDKGTLTQLKNYFYHRGVTNNVKESFNYNEEFLEFCGDGYIVLAALHFMGTSELFEIPEEIEEDFNNKLRYLNNVTAKIVDMVFSSVMPLVDRITTAQDADVEEEEEYQYCTCKTNIGGPMVFCENRNCVRGTWFHLECLQMDEDDVPEGKWFCCEECKKEGAKRKTRRGRRKTASALLDAKQNYVINIMRSALDQKIRRDAIRENDGNRIIIHWKFDMLQFIEKHHPKYFLIGQRLLAAVGGAVSPRLRHSLIWNRTVNPKGGQGKNIAIDLQMEYYNKEYKESVKDASGMLTETTIARHSQMIGVGKELRRIYEKQVSGLSGRTIHKTTEVNREKDIAEFVTLLHREDFFTRRPGRYFTQYPDMDLNVYPSIVPKKVRSRLSTLTKTLSKRQQLVLSMQRN